MLPGELNALHRSFTVFVTESVHAGHGPSLGRTQGATTFRVAAWFAAAVLSLAVTPCIAPLAFMA